MERAVTVAELIRQLADTDFTLDVYMEIGRHRISASEEVPVCGVDTVTDPVGTRVVIHDFKE
jgi:hypothetical protein